MARYATTDELRREIDLEASDADTIAVLEALLDAASQNIDMVCNRLILAPALATSRLYLGSGTRFLRINECIDITEVATRASGSDDEWDVWATTTLPLEGDIPDGDWIPYTGSPARPDFHNLPYTSIMVDPRGERSYFPTSEYAAPTVQVTARWGYSATIPYVVNQTCIMQSARWFKRLEGAMSDSLASGDVGRLLYRRALDPAIERLLDQGRMIVPAVGGR